MRQELHYSSELRERGSLVQSEVRSGSERYGFPYVHKKIQQMIMGTDCKMKEPDVAFYHLSIFIINLSFLFMGKNHCFWHSPPQE